MPGDTLLTDERGQLAPRTLERAIRAARTKVDGLPDGFRYHDLRHYFASLLIASGADVKTRGSRQRPQHPRDLAAERRQRDRHHVPVGP